MLVENFLIWVVSATFVPGQSATTAPPPLQDNGQRVLNYLFHTLWELPPSKSTIVSLRRLLNTQWSLVACVGTSFVVTELYDRRRTLYGIANRALRTVAVARFIRTVAFILTVVPSQNPNCYRQRGFPVPPPRQWIDWIWIGIIPRSHGGCNDLIVSGHATIISTCEYCFFWSGNDAYCVGWCPTHYRSYFPQNLNVAPHFALGPHQWPVFPHPSPMTWPLRLHYGPWWWWISWSRYMKAFTIRWICGWESFWWHCYGMCYIRVKVCHRNQEMWRYRTKRRPHIISSSSSKTLWRHVVLLRMSYLRWWPICSWLSLHKTLPTLLLLALSCRPCLFTFSLRQRKRHLPIYENGIYTTLNIYYCV